MRTCSTRCRAGRSSAARSRSGSSTTCSTPRPARRPAARCCSPARRASARRGSPRRSRSARPRSSMLVLRGECVDFGGEELPYAPFVAALRNLPEDWLRGAPRGARRGAARRARPGAPARPAPAPIPVTDTGRRGCASSCSTCSSRLSADGAPVLLVLEDLHWADRSSRDVLAFLGRNLRDERIAIALTYRTGELESAAPAAAAARRAGAAAERHPRGPRAARPRRRSRSSSRRSRASRSGARSPTSCPPVRRQPVLRGGAVRRAPERRPAARPRSPRPCWRASARSSPRRSGC